MAGRRRTLHSIKKHPYAIIFILAYKKDVMARYLIAPSILSADFAYLGRETREVISAGADWIHFDVMDGHYVPNLSFGPMICASLKKEVGQIPIDVHLMVEKVDLLISAFLQAGATYISFHPEATWHPHRSLRLIKESGGKAGLALNPGSSLNLLDETVLSEMDYLLLMTVNPGFGGQQFIESSLNKIRSARHLLDDYNQKTGRNILLQVDGGIDQHTILPAAEAGAEIFVAGSAIFKEKNRSAALKTLRHILERKREK